MEKQSQRERIFDYAKKTYGTSPEYLWKRYPSYAVLRHADNRKWYGIVMYVRGEAAGCAAEEGADLLNVKVPDRAMHDLLLSQKGFLPAWHMNREKWLSVRLDGSVKDPSVFRLLDESFLATASKETAARRRGKAEWILPANYSYADPRHFFDETDTVTWTQSSSVRPGDIVYIYAGVPIGAILYRCQAVETDLPAEGDMREHFRSGRMMILRLLTRYPETLFSRERLKTEFGVTNVRGPRYAPDRLAAALKKYSNRSK